MRARLYPCKFQHIYCDVFLCQGETKWFVGDPGGPESTTFRLCDECAKALVANAPDELVPETVKANLWQETPAPDKSRRTAIVADIVNEEEESTPADTKPAGGRPRKTK